MRLADQIVITTGAGLITLRPTLRAAMRLDRRYDGFQAVIDAVIAGNLTIILDVLKSAPRRPAFRQSFA